MSRVNEEILNSPKALFEHLRRQCCHKIKNQFIITFEIYINNSIQLTYSIIRSRKSTPIVFL